MNNDRFVIQFYKRVDNSSLDYVGQCVYNKLIEHGFVVNLWGINKPIEGQKIAPADLAILYGLPQDLKWLNRHKDKVAGLVYEYELSKKEIGFIKGADLKEIWVPSDHCLKLFQKAGINNLMLMPHGVDNHEVSMASFNDEFNFLMVFNSYKKLNEHVVRKNIFNVLKAFAKVKKNYPAAKLILRTKKQPYYNSYPLDGVVFVEERLDSLDELCKNVHCVLTPSDAEGFGLVGLEALIRAIPLISTKTGNDYLNEAVKYIHLDLPVTAESLEQCMLDVIMSYDNYKMESLHQRDIVYEANSWQYIGKMAANRVEHILTEKWGLK